MVMIDLFRYAQIMDAHAQAHLSQSELAALAAYQLNPFTVAAGRHHFGTDPLAVASGSAANLLPTIFSAASSAMATSTSTRPPIHTFIGGGGATAKAAIESPMSLFGNTAATSAIAGQQSATGAAAMGALDQHAHRLAAASGHTSSWCLFVYNLAPETEEHVIWKLFGPFGAVQQVNLVKDQTTAKCKGFAFVTMSDYNQALMAVQSLNGYTLANRVLQVSFKTSKVRKTMQGAGGIGEVH